MVWNECRVHTRQLQKIQISVFFYMATQPTVARSPIYIAALIWPFLLSPLLVLVLPQTFTPTALYVALISTNKCL